MLTLVQLETSNCSRCHNRMLAELRKRDDVVSVRSDFSKGCLVIEHEDDTAALIALIADATRGVATAANGERVMVYVDPHALAQCPYSDDRGC